MESTSSAYIVRGESKEDSRLWFASRRMDFEPFCAEGGCLLESRFRGHLRVFSEKCEANDFVGKYKGLPHQYVDILTIEKASSELLESLAHFKVERTIIIERLYAKVHRTIASFDFHAARAAMVIAKNTYGDEQEPPSTERLRIIARSLMIRAINEDNDAFQDYYYECGMKAWRSIDDLFLTSEIIALCLVP